MFSPLSICIGLRYTRAKRRNQFISFISLMSMLGLALGVLALITVLSVMNGFERELRIRILGLAEHGTVTGKDERLADWSRQRAIAMQHPQVVGVAPYVDGEAMLTNGSFVHGARLRGIVPDLEPAVSDLAGYMVEGRFTDLRPGEAGIVLGVGLARRIGAGVGSRVNVLAPRAEPGRGVTVPGIARFTVVGLFEVGHGQYDTGLALMHLNDAAGLFGLGGEVSGLRLKMDDLFAAPAVSKALQETFGTDFRVRDWTVQHATFFAALRTEKTVMFFILALIVAVAAFNIIATLVMLVNDKRPDIAVLRTLGISPGDVLRIFMVQGLVIGVLGTFLGVVGGVGLAINIETLVPALEALFGIEILDKSVFYVSEVPSELRWPDVVRVAATALGLSVVATFYPAWSASRTDPAEALRDE